MASSTEIQYSQEKFKQLEDLIVDLESPSLDHLSSIQQKECGLRNLRVLATELEQHDYLEILAPINSTPFELWYCLDFHHSASLLVRMDLWLLNSEADTDSDASITEVGFPKFATAVAKSCTSRSDWLLKWFWRSVYSGFPKLIEQPMKERLQAYPCPINCREGGLREFYHTVVYRQLEKFSNCKDLQDYELAQVAIKSACKPEGPDTKPLQNLLTEVFSENSVFNCISAEFLFLEFSCVPDRLRVLEEKVRGLSEKSIENNERAFQDLCWALIEISQKDKFESNHPVTRSLILASSSFYSDCPEAIDRWLEECGERLTGESLTLLMEGYAAEQYPWIGEFVANYCDRNGYLLSETEPKNLHPHNLEKESEPPIVLSSLCLNRFYLEDVESQWAPYRGYSVEQILSELFDNSVLIENQIVKLGQLIRCSRSELRENGCFDGNSMISEESYQAVVSEFVSDDFDRKVSPNITAYMLYTRLCKPHLGGDQFILRLDKCMGKLRRRLRDDHGAWKIGDYAFVLNELSIAGEYEKILKSLVFAFKTAPSCGSSDALRVHWDLHHWAVQELSNKDIALNWYLAKWLPEQVLETDLKDMGNLTPEADEKRKVASLRQLTEVLSQFCVTSLQMKKSEGTKITAAYTPAQCKESNSHWRRAFLDAMAECRIDRGGSAHRIADFVRRNDFDNNTRNTAHLAHNSLRKLKPFKTSRDIHRSYLAALWCIRIGRANAAKIEFDRGLAKRWRSRELQRVQ